MHLSVVIPLYNEEETIPSLVAALEASLPPETECVFVDDGSKDRTINELRARMKPHWQLVVFRRNYGQTSAIAAGIAAARGDYIATMDGDLQNDPADIPTMLGKLKAEQVDIVVGWRQKRKDGMFLRKIPSKIANRLIRRISGVHVHDYGCTLKVFTRDTAKLLDLYGELHRFIPILASLSGAKIVEMPVRHHARQFGVSKYGIMRTFRVVSDLLLMFFFQKYRQKPMHLFGTLGMASFGLGSLALGYLFVLKLMGESIGTRPLFYIGILLWITALQLVTTGFISELLMRTYFESQNKKPYRIREHLADGKSLPVTL